MPLRFGFGEDKFLPWNPVINQRKKQAAELFPIKLPDLSKTPPVAPVENKPLDFAAEYDRINKNRPNRLAYQQAIEEGAPQIQRGKWAKLGALIAAGGTALGGESPTNAVNLALSSYYEPQRRSDERYAQKTQGLERLSQFEDQDVQGQMEALRNQRQDYYDEANLGLQRRQSERADLQETRAAEMDKVQIQNIKDEIEHRGITIVQDEDGWSYAVKPGSDYKVRLLKTGKSSDEQYAELGRKLELEDRWKAKEQGREQIGRERIERMGNESAERIADKNITGRETVANINAKAKAAATVAKINQVASTATGRAKEQLLALQAAINSEPALAQFNLNDLLEKGGDIYKVKPDDEGTLGFGADSNEVKAAKARLRVILNSIPSVTSPGITTPNIPDPNDPMGILGGRGRGGG